MLYRLIDGDKCICEFRLIDKSFNHITGVLLDITGSSVEDTYISDYCFIANVTIKRSMCSHFYFYGSEYEKFEDGTEFEKDSYYHLCGAKNYITFIRGISFVCELAKRLIDNCDTSEFDEVLKLDLLKGCTIIELDEVV